MTDDQRFMSAALRLASRNKGLTGTNPSVACLLVDTNSNGPRLLGYGITAEGGRPHAEPLALAEVGAATRGSTAYVTLEPCAHHGTTPPCAQALIASGVKRVVTAVIDPDPRVSGKGHAMLVDAGIEVQSLVTSRDSMAPIEGYLSRKNRGLPFVTLKLAMTPEGEMGLKGEGMVPITGKVALAQVHLMRARHDAILIGSGTALADDPALTCRLAGLENRSPLRVVLDANATLSKRLKLVSGAKAQSTMIVAPGTVDPEWRNVMEQAGCTLLPCDLSNGRVALPELLEDLALRGISSVMVEGGAAVAKSFLDLDLVDAIELFIGAANLKEADAEQVIWSPINLQSARNRFREVDRWLYPNPNNETDDVHLRLEKR